MDDPARWVPVSGPLFPLFEEEGPTEWISHPHVAAACPVVEPEPEWPGVESVVDVAMDADPQEWVGAWREFGEDNPIMRAVLAERNQPADAADAA